MTKRAKRTALTTGGALAILTLAGVLLARPRHPYAFLKGCATTVVRIDTYHFPGSGTAPVPTKVFTMRFRCDRNFESVADSAAQEMAKDGWETIVIDDLMYAEMSHGNDGLVQIRGKEGVTHVRVFKRKADWSDKLQAWAWSLSNEVPPIDKDP